MALPSTVYRASIELSDMDRGIFEHLQATVARHPSETEERLVARLLAFALCYEPELAFTKGIGAGDEPDLWVRGPDGRTTLWVEVGLPDPERLVKASRHAARVVLLAAGSSRRRWEEQHLPRLAALPNLTVVGLDHVFLRGLAERLERSVSWTLTLTEGTLYLTVGGETLETTLVRLAGAAPA